MRGGKLPRAAGRFLSGKAPSALPGKPPASARARPAYGDAQTSAVACTSHSEAPASALPMAVAASTSLG